MDTLQFLLALFVIVLSVEIQLFYHLIPYNSLTSAFFIVIYSFILVAMKTLQPRLKLPPLLLAFLLIFSIHYSFIPRAIVPDDDPYLKGTVDIDFVERSGLLLDKWHFCVGEHADFGFKGIAPFTLYYYCGSSNHTLTSNTNRQLFVIPDKTCHLHSLRDGLGNTVPLPDWQVVDCPAVHFDRAHIDVCVGDDVELPLNPTGEGPLTLEIQVRTEKETLLQTLSTKDTQSLKLETKELGMIYFSLQSVTDRYGNIVKLNDQFALIKIHSKPTARFESAEAFFKTIPFKAPLILTGSNPRVTIKGKEGKEKEILMREEGAVTLLTVQDDFCSGEVLQPSTFTLKPIPPPTISIATLPIEKVCFGKVGLDLELTMTGQAPFHIILITYHDEKFKSERIRIAKNHHVLKLMPSRPGNYRFELKKISDANYPQGVEVDKHVDVVIHAQSNAAFLSNQQTICIGANQIHVDMEGSGPWNLEWALVKSGEEPRVSVTFIEVSEAAFQLPILVEEQGEWSIVLREIKDKNGCVKKLTNILDLHVVDTQPSVKVLETKVHFVEGKTGKARLALQGIPPFQLSFTQGEKTNTVTLTDVNAELELRSNARLLSISDRYCPGRIEEDEIELVPFTLPSLKFEFQNSFACQGEPIALDLHFEGTAPFTLSFAIDGVDSSHVSLTSHSVLHLSLDPGQHSLVLQSLQDENYKIHPTRTIPLSVQPLPEFKWNLPTCANPFLTGSASTEATVSASVHTSTQTLTSNDVNPSFSISGHFNATADVKINNCTKTFTISGFAPAAPAAIPLQADVCIISPIEWSLSGAYPYTLILEAEETYRWRHYSLASLVFQPRVAKPHKLTLCSGDCCVESTVNVHNIPRAKLEQGKDEKWYKVEGEQVELKVSVEGEGPFAVTLVREGAGEREVRVVEGVENILKVRVGEKGSWKLMGVKDKWCEYFREA